MDDASALQHLPRQTQTPRMSLASKCISKIVSLFARHARQTHQVSTEVSAAGGPSPSFPFSRLPYDVRTIIYHHLETGLPLAPRYDCPGFLLSCRQNKAEIEEFACGRLKSVYAGVKNTSSFDIAIKSDNGLRSITVVLPNTAFQDLSSSRPWWKREVLSSLQPLFAYPFDTLRIAISHEAYPSPSTSRHDIQCTLRSLMQNLGTMIEHSNTCNPQAHSTHNAPHKIDTIFQPGSAEKVTPFPSTTVRARRICLSWDDRPPPQPPFQLRGRLVHTTPQPQEVRKRKLQYKQEEKPRNPLFPDPLQTMTVYELHSPMCPVAEIGIVSPTRWSLDLLQKTSLVRAIERFDLCRGTVVSSLGLGAELEYGISGVRVQRLEDEEERRYAEAVERNFEFEVTMACIEEGYMPY